MFGDIFGRVFDALYAQLVPIPLDNTLSIVYVVLNIILTFLAPFIGTQ